MKNRNKIILCSAFAGYVLLMLWLLFGQRMGMDLSTWRETYWVEFAQRINLIPMRTIAEFWNNLRGGGRSHAIINLFGNVVMFLPLGFFIPCVFPKVKNFRRSMFFAMGILVCIESIQLVTLLGSMDIDDFILNMIGTAIGYGVYDTQK